MEGGPVDPFNDPAWDRPPTYARSPIRGQLVAVMDFKRLDRGLSLIRQRTRCLRCYDVHELILTDDSEATAGSVVNRVAYLGFSEFLSGGVAAEDDVLFVGSVRVGTIAGFDETHMPNHLNIVVKSPVFACGRDLGLKLGDSIVIGMNRPGFAGNCIQVA